MLGGVWFYLKRDNKRYLTILMIHCILVPLEVCVELEYYSSNLNNNITFACSFFIVSFSLFLTQFIVCFSSSLSLSVVFFYFFFAYSSPIYLSASSFSYYLSHCLYFFVLLFSFSLSFFYLFSYSHFKHYSLNLIRSFPFFLYLFFTL